MRYIKSDDYINTIVWNPEGTKWVTVAKSTYRSSKHRNKRLLLCSVAIGLLCWFYNPTTTFKHQTFDVVEINVAANQAEQVE
jgi:hypothetical protein